MFSPYYLHVHSTGFSDILASNTHTSVTRSFDELLRHISFDHRSSTNFSDILVSNTSEIWFGQPFSPGHSVLSPMRVLTRPGHSVLSPMRALTRPTSSGCVYPTDRSISCFPKFRKTGFTILRTQIVISSTIDSLSPAFASSL